MGCTRRDFITWSAAAGTWMYVSGLTGSSRFLEKVFAAAIPGGTLDPLTVTKFQTPLLIPPVMPRAGRVKTGKGKPADYYEISMKQFTQQILPAPLPATTVWGYGPVAAAMKNALLVHNAPSLTIEAKQGVPVRVKWINDLKDAAGNFLPHLLPIDPTLHWANPPGGMMHRDHRPTFTTTPGPYTGPVPIVTHVHGAAVIGDDSDGYPEAWYLPAATNIPAGYATEGTWYNFFAGKAAANYGVTWGPGYATFQYPNANRASTIWYHDHALGMTRTNVYTGPAGFYIIRGGKTDQVLDSRTSLPAVLPGPAPKEGDPFPSTKPYYEIPVAIQDRAFNADGSLFYPDTRAFFDGATAIDPGFIPATDLSPMWNPEFFGNMIMVNGNTWPFQTVEQRRYRFRFLNGCQSRFLILDFAQIPGVQVWMIGNDGGFLPTPVDVTTALSNQLLLGLAERADLIVDFTNVAVGNYVLGNVGPDAPFGGGIPGTDFIVSDVASTGQIMEFRVVPAISADLTTPPQFLALPPIPPMIAPAVTRKVSLNEVMSMSMWSDGMGGMTSGPAEALLGTVDAAGNPVALTWMAAITENPNPGTTEIWEIYNFTADAHPIHVHDLDFEVINREGLVLDLVGDVALPVQLTGVVRPPDPPETGTKDTITAYPGEVTRIKTPFTNTGQFVWHCHILEHEDNEMMRPYRIGPAQPGEPVPMVMP